ncbi:membrane protein insertase YidC [Tropicibacter naphthalenivorans]|uniref:Membrane protein insertase YidC n=1 Tax=Tropicibacter naphthalenivorans TaxID=441103 RepID=A0A0N7LZW5_9RHOB|nr:membrane protein insertase YidC [Tropicibacter naphthalenivorans]CUH78801.1 Oxa1Ec [Tropicibacter naphthalenivorans]SMC81594.1 protein translocase subunit yidC [Tropicibacter naphthalenivorans]
MDDQNKNLLLATALSFAVILVWFYFFPPPETVEDPNAPAAVETVADADIATAPAAAPSAAGDALAATETTEAPRLPLETERLEGSISLTGGRIDDLRLKDYRETLEEGSPIVQMLDPAGNDDAYYALYGWAPGAGLSLDDVPGANTPWTVETGETLTAQTPVILRWDSPSGLIFRRSISIDQDFMFTVTQTVENPGDATVSLAPYGIVARHGEPADVKNFFVLHEGVVAMADGTLSEIGYSDMPDFDINPNEGARAEVTQVSENGWIGFTDHYWMTALIPAPGSAFKQVAKYDEARDIYQTEAVLPTLQLAAGATQSVTTQLFAGAKEWETIGDYQEQGIQGFIDSIDWGWFFFLTKPIFAILHWLNGVIGNMGIAIIVLTLMIKAVLFPLAYKSYVSMARMKELQPEMEKIKERAGDDREKLQKEMMALYKEKKVNPAAGCLPILLQIPIFFSLYKVIFVTLELRHAPFFGPFQDLSAPDPTSLWNLFGAFPWPAPEAGSIFALVFIGILPLLLGISMWLQQKLNPAPADPTQQMIFAWMPWVFMFMLGGFASGLVVYWIANNTITFTQQYIIMRSQGYTPDVFGNIKKSLKREKSDAK